MFSCNSCVKNVSCVITPPRVLFTTIAGSGDRFGYIHYLYVNGLNRECIDSVMIDSLVANYLDTISIGKPVDMLRMYNSLEHYNPDEESQFKEFEIDCLLWISIDNDRITSYGSFDPNGDNFILSPSFNVGALRK